jgi:hypothetical protein
MSFFSFFEKVFTKLQILSTKKNIDQTSLFRKINIQQRSAKQQS